MHSLLTDVPGRILRKNLSKVHPLTRMEREPFGGSISASDPCTLVDRFQPACTLVDRIQPACTLVDQQDTMFLAQDARLRPVVQSHSSLGGSAGYALSGSGCKTSSSTSEPQSSIRLSVLVLLLHLRTIRSLRTIYGKFTVTYTDFEHV